jgi:pre-mRNA-splicing factor SYF2
MEPPMAPKTAEEKHTERMERLKSLHLARTQARTLNHKEVVAEDERSKLPRNWEARKLQADWLQSDQKAKEQAATSGISYDRIKVLNVTASEAEKIDKIKQKKKNIDPGFSDYEAQTGELIFAKLKYLLLHIFQFSNSIF